MKVGSLFSGIGGFDLGLERAGFEISWQVEIDEYCRQVLKKHWPAVPCHYDIRSIDWQWVQPVDLVCGGFPCQPFSCAGKRRGSADDRYLWPEVVRCLAVLRPTWFLSENVPGLLHLGIDTVLADLAALGYQTAVLGIPACAVDAPHIRQRVWIVAHADGCREMGERRERMCDDKEWNDSAEVQEWENEQLGTHTASGEALADAVEHGRDTFRIRTGEDLSECDKTPRQFDASRSNVADAKKLRLGRRRNKPEGHRSRVRPQQLMGESGGNYWRWLSEPDVGRVAHGIPARVDRLRGLGNAIVPQIAEALGRMIKEASCLTQTGRIL